MSWDYILVDANWDRMKNGKIDELVKYADNMGIGIWLWYNSGGPYNAVTEAPRNLMFDRKIRQSEFKRLSEMGIKGVKIDFFQSDKPGVIRQYHDILEDAMVYKILVNFHGCTIPRGWARTYPNNLSAEAVRGAECYLFDKSYPETAPSHNAILPFTRNVIGSMDYTPVTFSDVVHKHKTSFGHELALSVIFESGIEHFADRASAYLKLPVFVKQFLCEVPNTWDETRFLDGYPGQFIVLERQKNGIVYLGGINGMNEEKRIKINLPFMDEGSYLLEIITDGEKERSFMYFKKPFNNKTELPLTLKPRGGFVAKLIKPE
jgi:alpha-glucosidase